MHYFLFVRLSNQTDEQIAVSVKGIFEKESQADGIIIALAQQGFDLIYTEDRGDLDPDTFGGPEAAELEDKSSRIVAEYISTVLSGKEWQSDSVGTKPRLMWQKSIDVEFVKTMMEETNASHMLLKQVLTRTVKRMNSLVPSEYEVTLAEDGSCKFHFMPSHKMFTPEEEEKETLMADTIVNGLSLLMYSLINELSKSMPESGD